MTINLATDTMTDLVDAVNDAETQLEDLDTRVTVLESVKPGSVLLGHYIASANSPSLQVLTRTANGTSGALFQADYETYEIVVNCFVPTDAGQNLYLQLTYDGGIIFQESNYIRTYFWQGSDGSSGSNASYGDPGWILADTPKNAVADGVSGSGRIMNPTDGTTYTVCHGMFSFRNNNNNYYYWNRVHTLHAVTDVATGFQMLFSGGSTITRGSLTVYGLNK